jgi:N-acetylneuraminic acid mutarotase
MRRAPIGPRAPTARRAFLGAALLVASIVLAACGGGGGSDGQRASTSTTAPATTGVPATTQPTSTTAPSTTAPSGTVQAVTAPWKLNEPVAREIVIANGNQLEIVGGLDHTKFSTAAVVLVDPTSGAQQSPAKLTEAVHDAAGSLVGGKVLVFGGGGPSENGTADVQAVPASGTATIIGRLPGSRSDHVAATVGNRAYVFSGFDGTTILPSVLSTADGVTFDPVGNLPVPVRYAAFAAVGKTVYLFGGVASTSGNDTNAIQALDTSNGTITQVAQLPTSLSHASAVVIGGKVYVLGGYVNNSTLSDQILRFDPATKAITAAGKLPIPVSDAAAATIGDKGYLVGGQSTDRNPLASVVIVTAG